jgi:hypothetical protein
MLKENGLIQFNKHDVATAREAQLVMAKVKARYALALMNPRDIIKEVEPKIAELCSRREFAEEAKYQVVVGGHYDKNGKWIKDYDIDLNIRAAEQLMVCYRNIFDEVNTVYEDDELRRVAFEMTDLETGVTHRDEFTIYKTQERKKLKKDKSGKLTQEAISTRINSNGQEIYIVACTPEEVQKKQNAQVSRKMRKMFFRLFPVDLKIKARKYIDATLIGEIKKNLPDERAKITVAFARLGVTGNDIEEYLGIGLSKITENDILRLRRVWQSLNDGIARWSDYVTEEDKKPKPEESTFNMDDIKDEMIPPKEEKKEKPKKKSTPDANKKAKQSTQKNKQPVEKKVDEKKPEKPVEEKKVDKSSGARERVAKVLSDPNLSKEGYSLAGRALDSAKLPYADIKLFTPDMMKTSAVPHNYIEAIDKKFEESGLYK